MCIEVIRIVTPLIGVTFGAWLAYRYAVKRLHKESIAGIERKKYEAILAAHQSMYKLLKYTTNSENPASILVWEKAKEGNVPTVYFFRKDCITAFLNALPEEFYEKGSGLFLSQDVAELFFEYRGIVYGMLLATQSRKENRIKIEKPETAERMITIHNELSRKIRESIALDERKLKRK